MASIKESWSPKDYLKQYYTLEKLSTDEVKLFKYIIDFLDKFPRNYFENFIDFGAGPTVHRLIPFAFHVKNIYIADYNTENLKEIENWIKELGNAHGWDDQVRHILKLKHQSNASKNFNLYKKTIRGKIKKLMVCDILKTQPIKIKKKFDCLASFYCADSITPSKKVWERAMKNMLGLVKPGGWIILAALRKKESAEGPDH
jgi:SAM-dependent methyltransferase